MGETYRGHTVIQHTGEVTGYASWIARLPARGKACAIFINDDDLAIPLDWLLGCKWMDTVLEIEPYNWEEWEIKKLFTS